MGTKDIKKKSKTSSKKSVLLLIALFLVLIISSGCGYFYYQLSKVKTTKISKDNQSLGISDKVLKETSSISNAPMNIALLGVDRRSRNERGNSDTIMIASIDKANKKIKLSSIMRDTRVKIDGHGLGKINSAYLLGGPQLTIKTINQNFDMNIKNFVTVDFFDMEKIINALGGVSVDVKRNEIAPINQYMQELAEIKNTKVKNVTKPGVQTLNGEQALSYSRIRSVGNGDYQRTERQRTVLTALLNKIQERGITSYPSTVSKLLPYVETSFSSLDLLSIGKNVLISGTKNIEQARFPMDNACKEKYIKGASYIVPDFEKTKEQLHSFIFKDIKPQ